MVKTINARRILNFPLMLMIAISLLISVTTIESYAASKPAKVKSLTATPYAERGVSLSWAKIKGATGYEISKDWFDIAKTNTTSYTDTDHEYGNTYEYRVRAYKKTKVRKYYNKKTKKWQKKKPAKKYRGKTKTVTSYIYGPYSSVLKVKANDQRTRIVGDVYSCIKYENDIYCSDICHIYKINLDDKSVTVIEDKMYAEYLTLVGDQLYYSVHGNGAVNDVQYWRMDLKTGKKKLIVSDSGSYEYAIYGDRIYYQKHTNNDYGYYNCSVDLDGKGLRQENISMTVNYNNSDGSGYSQYVEDIYETDERINYVITPSGSRIDFSRGRYEESIASNSGYRDGAFTISAEEIAKRMTYHFMTYGNWLCESMDGCSFYDIIEDVDTSKAGIWKAVSTVEGRTTTLTMYKNGQKCSWSDIPDRVEMNIWFTTGVEPNTEASRYALMMVLDPGYSFNRTRLDIEPNYMGNHDRVFYRGDALVKFECEYDGYPAYDTMDVKGKWIIE